MSYNLSIISNQSGLVPIMQTVNSELMFGWYGIMILFTIVAIAFMSFLHTTNDPKKSIAAASFMAFISSIFLKGMSLIPDLAIFITLMAVALSAAWLFFTN